MSAKAMTVCLPSSLVETIDHYNETDWSRFDSIGPLNAVAFIGEQVAAVVARQRARARRGR